MSYFFNVLCNLIFTLKFYPGFDFVNALNKPEGRNVCIKKRDMWGSLLSIFLSFKFIKFRSKHSESSGSFLTSGILVG